MSIKAMRQALEALETLARYENPETRIQVRKPKDGGPIVTMYPHKVASDAAAAIRAAIEQVEKQEPVCDKDPRGCWSVRCQLEKKCKNTPPAAPRQEQYDQTALELCEECGWKALIPGDGCLVCARQKPTAWMYDFLSDNRDEVIRDWMTQDYADITRERGFNVRPLYTAPPATTQKPVAYADERIHGWPDCFVMEPDPPHTVPLYTAPRQWVGLTEGEMDEFYWVSASTIKAIEAKLKERNHAG
jgi:hypothetical protein